MSTFLYKFRCFRCGKLAFRSLKTKDGRKMPYCSEHEYVARSENLEEQP